MASQLVPPSTPGPGSDAQAEPAHGRFSGFWNALFNYAEAEIESPPDGRERTHEAAACLAPLLKARGYRGGEFRKFEALPHFRDAMDVADLRAALVNLGYATEPRRTRPCDIDNHLLPCLHECTKTGEVIVLLGRSGDTIEAYTSGVTRELSQAEAERRGNAYFLKPYLSDPDAAGLSWSKRLLHRFKGVVTQLLAISALTNLLSIAIPLLVMTIYDRVIAYRSLDALPMLLIGILIVMTTDIYLKALRANLLGALAMRVDYLIATATFAKLIRLPLSFTDGPSISSQMARLREFQSVRDLFAGPAATAMIDFPFSIIALAVIAMVAGWLVLAPIIACAIFALIGFLGSKWLHRYERSQSVASTELFNHITDTTLHQESIKREGGEKVWLHRFRLKSAASATRMMRLQTRSAFVEALSQFLGSAAALGVLVSGAVMVMNGAITVGALIATMALTWRILSPAQQLFQTLARIGRLRSSIRTMDQMLSLADESDTSATNLARQPKQGRIAFNRVSLRYTKDGEPAISNINLTIPPGKMIAIAGPNGAGKSSILRLIQGLYQPQSGTVTIEGSDIRQIPPHVLRRSIACAPQKMHFFYGTIAQNLRFSDPLADDFALHRAADIAGILDEILALPRGFETRLGDISTSNVPPGFQRQLIIARALVRETPILLLDEPESMLDDQGAFLVGRALERLRGSRTVVFVSHRPSYIRLADFAIFMRRSGIEYGGNPDGAIEKMLGIEKSGIAA